MTLAAPARSRQSVQPPVDEPASRQSSPEGSISNRSNAALSFDPPRETYGRGSGIRSTDAEDATRVAGLSVRLPATSTLPPERTSAASSLLATSSRLTSSSSRRRRAINRSRSRPDDHRHPPSAHHLR